MYTVIRRSLKDICPGIGHLPLIYPKGLEQKEVAGLV
jgi:hypothetical protein